MGGRGSAIFLTRFSTVYDFGAGQCQVCCNFNDDTLKLLCGKSRGKMDTLILSSCNTFLKKCVTLKMPLDKLVLFVDNGGGNAYITK